MLVLSWSHLALFSARNIPIFAVMMVPSISLATSEWLEYTSSHWPLEWPRAISASVAEVEAGLRMIANSQKKPRWHLVPCLAVLVLALLLEHPGRVRELRADFDQDRFPADAASFLSQRRSIAPMRLYSSCNGVVSDLPTLAFHYGLRRWTNRFLRSCIRGRRAARMECISGLAKCLRALSCECCAAPIDSALATVLREKPDWKPLYQDRIAVLYTKTDGD